MFTPRGFEIRDWVSPRPRPGTINPLRMLRLNPDALAYGCITSGFLVSSLLDDREFPDPVSHCRALMGVRFLLISVVMSSSGCSYAPSQPVLAPGRHVLRRSVDISTILTIPLTPVSQLS